jgi:integrase
LRLALERSSGRVFRCDLRGGERVVADDDLAVLECRYEDAGGVGRVRGRLRSAIARACKASGTPTWSPHDLRHRRISLWHRQGETWALIGARVGQRSLSVTADTYTHVLLDDRELDHPRLAAELGLTDA